MLDVNILFKASSQFGSEDRMSSNLLVINAHTGEQSNLPSTAQSSIDSFKSWIYTQTHVAPPDQILLTASGKQAKLQAILTEVRHPERLTGHGLTLVNQHEIYLYSRQLISPANSKTPRDLSLSGRSTLPATPPPPPSDANPYQNDIHAWRRSFDARRDWACDLLNSSQALVNEAKRQCHAVENIQKALGVAVGNLESHLRTLSSKHGEARDWARHTTREQDDALHAVETAHAQMPHLPANLDFLRLLPKLGDVISQETKPASNGSTMLTRFVDTRSVAEGITAVRQTRKSVIDQTTSLDSGMKRIQAERDLVVEAYERLGAGSASGANQAAEELLEEIQVLVKKITSDSEHVSSLQTSPKTISQITKMAQSHSKEYLPRLSEYFEELVNISQKSKEDQGLAATESLQTMQGIARIEGVLSQLLAQLSNLGISEEAEAAFEYLSLVGQLPFVYGALLVETVRRREWSDRLKAESAELAEDIAGYREEEEKRRKRWMKNIGHLINQEAVAGDVLNFELNLATDQQIWPDVVRDDISDYLRALRELDGVDEIVEELSEAAKDLDRLTKRQIKKAKSTFKNGSIHEAGSVRGSFLMRESDEVRVLRDSNSRLEEDLKGQKSRVRKLEDLLYKQQQRPSSANIFVPGDSSRRSSMTPDQEPPSPRADGNISRRVSTASRRQSATKSTDEKALARRIMILETELQDERQKRRDESDARAATEHRIKTEIEEGNSTKKDLMENMEAQQREFADERRLLQTEVREHKEKVEEMEDEVDRILGSRDHEKNTLDDRIRDFESKLHEARKSLAEVAGEREARKEAEAEHTAMLLNVRNGLGAVGDAPQSLAELLHELESLVERSLRHENDLKQTIASTTADKDGLQATLDQQRSDLETYKDGTRALEDEITGVRSECSAERAKSASIAAELDDARSQLKILRTKFADGETGSEALRGRLEEQAARAGNLTTELAETKSHVNSLDFELSSLQRSFKKTQADAETSNKRLEQRSGRDRELTQNLVTVQDELLKLLEALGLSVFHRDGTLAIQRTSKLNASSSGLAESAQLPLPSLIDLKPDERQLQWMHAPTPEEEAQAFSELITKLAALNVSTFSDAILKLRRDVEWTGKKWKGEARTMRDKYFRAQAEGHEKIAFRSFKEGDLALFLPTRNQATRPWAAFNIGAPHYFLREQDSHKLQHREWLVARISKIEERVVDLSRSIAGMKPKDKDKDAASIKSTGGESGISFDEENPFELSDGLRWYLLDASEERPSTTGAPSTPGLGKSTVASAKVDVKGSVRMRRSPKDHPEKEVSKMLNKSLDTDRSRRSSTSSKRASISAIPEETVEALRAAGASKRPGSRSSATVPTEPLAGLSIDAAGDARLSPSLEKKHDTLEPLGRPVPSPSRAREALQSAAATSPSRSGYLSVFGSASPPKSSSWIGRSSSRNRAGVSSENGISTMPSPSKPQTRPAVLRSPSKDVPSAPTGAAGIWPQRGISDANSRGTPVSPSKRAQHLQSQTQSQSRIAPTNQTAWESLWSLNFGVEEGTGREQ